MDVLEKANCSFVSVTQQFNTAHSMGRLTLNILLSFAQFERELISERTRDKIVASRKKGKWTGGYPILGYDIEPGTQKLRLNAKEAAIVRDIFALYLRHEAIRPIVLHGQSKSWHAKRWTTRNGRKMGGQPLNKKHVWATLSNPLYMGKVSVGEQLFDGEHPAIVDETTFNRVQTILAAHHQSSGIEVRNKHHALLRGLLFDAETGAALAHTFTKKGWRLYRYYTNTLAKRDGYATVNTRSLPAAQIETFVVDQIRHVAHDPKVHASVIAAAQEHLGHDHPFTHDDIEAAFSDFDAVWKGLVPREQERLVRLVIERIEVNLPLGKINITYRDAGLGRFVESRRSA